MIMVPQDPMSKRAEEERRMVSLSEEPVVASLVIIFGL